MKSKKKIFSIGLPGTGKSFLARLLVSETGAKTYDLDKLIEQNEGRKISDIFEEDGEARFREIEAATLLEVASKDSFILATGGGTPCFHNGIEVMNQIGITIYLKEKNEVIVDRLSRSSHRPLVQDDVANRVNQLLETRSQYYEKADLIIAHRDPKRLLAEIDQLEI